MLKIFEHTYENELDVRIIGTYLINQYYLSFSRYLQLAQKDDIKVKLSLNIQINICVYVFLNITFFRIRLNTNSSICNISGKAIRIKNRNDGTSNFLLYYTK